jgi:DMSO/TMAO reductase YedYZ molybdopterin-dependent catalytic subunit
MECSGNTGLPFFTGGVGNARWAGAQLRRLLRAAQPRAAADEVVFWGADRGSVTIRDNSGITAAGRTGTTAPDDGGGLDLTITEQFARSMTLAEAMAPDNLVAYSMNGEPLPPEHGFPARLIAPGWYGVANVKWLTLIELTSERFAGRFMARDYVTVREETRGGETVWTFTTVGKDRLKSAPARVTRTGARHTITGVAWGAPISRVEVSIDGGPFRPARLRGQLSGGKYSWRFWTYDWGTPAAGEHTVRSRAYDTAGNVQPTPEDPFVAGRRTYWEANGQITRRVRIG